MAYKQTAMFYRFVIVMILAGGIWALNHTAVTVQMSNEAKEILLQTNGAFIALLTMAVGWFFGSNKGSEDKTDSMIASAKLDAEADERNKGLVV